MNAHPAEPPWYGPVCPVVWEGRHREVPPYPDFYSAVLILGETSQPPFSLGCAAGQSLVAVYFWEVRYAMG